MARVPLSGATLVDNGVGSVQCMMEQEQTGWTWTDESTGSRADGGMWVQMLLPFASCVMCRRATAFGGRARVEMVWREANGLVASSSAP
ncbi:hypothetical protein E5D57_006634 [Metarhizium anisopliae]|nr:hypothetical protein E5D57_006634 [Metarhizium anisopliae]